MFIANVDRIKIIYAGSYSGLCYHTDGASHTSINDASVMAGLGLVVLDPITQEHTRRLTEWSLSPSVTSSVYFRLRRTPLPEVAVFDDFLPVFDSNFSPATPVTIIPAAANVRAASRTQDGAAAGSQGTEEGDEQQKHSRVGESGGGADGVRFVVMGTVSLFLALECVKASPVFKHAPISVVPALNAPLPPSDLSCWRSLLASHSTIMCIEDDTGALHRHVCLMCLQLRISPPPKVISKCIEKPGPSCRTFADCLRFHGFTVPHIEALCSSHE